MMWSGGLRVTLMAAGLFLLGVVPSRATAQAPPPGLPLGLNLGFTSFLDGGPPAGPGFYFQEYIQYYTAGTFRNQQGKKAPVPGSLDAWVSLNQLIYQSDDPLAVLGGPKWGIDLIVPLAKISAHPGGNSVVTTSSGVGDMYIGPFLQWMPIMGANGPILIHRAEVQVLAPTGNYDSHRLLNPGSNVWSLDPYWAGTVFIMPEWTASWRLHYLWNGKNENPFVGLNANTSQAGQATHLNFASEYEVIPKQLRVGLNGYYLKQFTNAQVNGNDVANSREQVLGLGPGVLYSFSQNDHLFFNAYFESQVENRPEGSRLNLRWTHHF
jgi:hypothetical protein